MAVSLPSDLIVDVMRNADPARLSGATAKLRALGGEEGQSATFAETLGELGTSQAQASVPARFAGSGSEPPVTADAHVEFERMVLRNLFESLLPDTGSGAFGTGPSAGVWRSLAADQLAGVYAEAGGIGIASTLRASSDGEPAPHAEWPYFTADRIVAFAG